MKELIKRLEECEGPSEELTRLIDAACPDVRPKNGTILDYTGSIDCALALVPEEYTFRCLTASGFLHGRDDAEPTGWTAHLQPRRRRLGEQDGWHKTSKQHAIIIAALNARVALRTHPAGRET